MPHITPELAAMELWPTDPDAARALQSRLASRVRVHPCDPDAVRLVAGLDVSYGPTELVAAAVVVDAATLEGHRPGHGARNADVPVCAGPVRVRELPPLLAALEQLPVEPDVYLCDGYGLAHPRRFGLACHLGVLVDRPVFGVAKTAFVGDAPNPARGGAQPPPGGPR